jgi:uncharacterized protein (DUF2062 family)
MTQEQCSRKLAFTCALGVYIGISPFPGLHTVMTFAFAWFFAVNLAVLLAVSMVINNPWTMLPVYSFDHLFGTWIFKYLQVDYLALDPAWMASLNLFLKEHTGITGISPIAFLVGGNVFAIVMAVISYPLLKSIFTHYYAHKQLINQQ